MRSHVVPEDNEDCISATYSDSEFLVQETCVKINGMINRLKPTC